MNWIGNLWTALRGDAATNFKAITSELKDIKEEYKSRMRELEGRVKENEGRIKELVTEQERMAAHEKECHRQVVDLTQKNRDMREELIFIKRMIKNNGNHDT
jgi:hypothetical protein